MATYGKFQDSGKEYRIIDLMKPLRHLINFSWNEKIISGVNQFGTGEGVFNNQTFLYNEQSGRARMIKDGRRYIYVKDTDDGSYWNIGHYPVCYEPSIRETIFGAGYSSFHYTANGVKTESLCFVDLDEPVEIWKIKLINLTERRRKLKVYPYVEWLLQGYTMASDYYSYLKSEYVESANAVISYNYAVERPHERYSGFIASSIEPNGYSGSSREFLGLYGDPVRPEALINGKLLCKPTCNENLAGALEIEITLEAGEEKELILLIGNTSDEKDTVRIVRKLLAENYVENVYTKLKREKEKIVNHTVIHTPDEIINNLTNVWAKNQVALCAEFGRDGVRGFRDTLQDSWAITTFNPTLAKEKIKEALMHQKKDGSALRGWMPVVTKLYSDGPVWITLAVTEYVKYSGDIDFLYDLVPYYDGDEGTVLDHMLRALRLLNKDLGIHGLCLAHMGDWNDSLDWMGKDGKGESVMTTMAHYNSLLLFIDLAKKILRDATLAEEMNKAAETFRESVEQHAWDGSWYLQGYSDFGNKVGSGENVQGSIYLVPQAWAVYSGIASESRAALAIASVKERLDSKAGYVMCSPSFTQRDENVGRLTTMIPGMYENGSCYCHGSAFAIAALLKQNKASEALALYKKVMPDSESNPSDFSGVEPYAYTNQYLGPENLRHGVSVSGWITGTAGWMYKNMIELMLGVHADYEGIIVNPCLPDEWDNASISTVIRGTRYNVKITRTNLPFKGIKTSNSLQSGNFIPYTDEDEVDLEVLI